jgi:Flp pilus assembly protein TadB
MYDTAYESLQYAAKELERERNKVDRLTQRIKELEEPESAEQAKRKRENALQFAASEAATTLAEAIHYTRISYVLVGTGAVLAGVAWTPLVPWLGLTLTLVVIGLLTIVGGVQRLADDKTNVVGIRSKREALRLAEHKLSTFYLEQ